MKMLRKLFNRMLLNIDFHLFSKVAYNIGYNDALKEVAKIVHEEKYPEYLQDELIKFLIDKEIKL